MAADSEYQTLCRSSSCDTTQLPDYTKTLIEVSPTSDVTLGLNLLEDGEGIFYYCDSRSKLLPPLTEFHLYPDLPPEIRRMIMRYTYPGPRMVELRFSEQVNSTQYDLVCEELPVALHVCKEWRNETTKSYPRLFGHRQCRRGCPTFFNARIDTLHLRDDYPFIPGFGLDRCKQIEDTLKILPDKEMVRKLSCTRNSFWRGPMEDIEKSKRFVFFLPRSYPGDIEKNTGWHKCHHGDCRRPTRSHGCGFVTEEMVGWVESSWMGTGNLRKDWTFLKEFLSWVEKGVWGDCKGWSVPVFQHGGLCRRVMVQREM